MSRLASPVLPAALAYRGRGWSVLPIRHDKRPHSAALLAASGSSGWRRLQEKPASEAEIRSWYYQFPDAGVAILTGRASGLVVVDFDGPLPGNLCLPVTPLVKTARGLHVYLESTDLVPGAKLAGGDLKAEGGYVAAPPSLHPSGQRYEWLVAPEGLATLTVPDAALVRFSDFNRSWCQSGSSPTSQVTDIGVDIYSCVLPSLSGEGQERKEERDLAEWDCDPAFAGAASALLGIPHVPIGPAFRCVLPGHHDAHPSASLFTEPRRHTVVYRDWHTGVWYTLTEVYAAQISGQVRKLAGPQHARWKLRLLVELGFLAPATVPLPPLPADAPEAARAVYAGFRLLLACRWIRDPQQATPFTSEFGAHWCGLTANRFEKGKRWLIERGLIEAAGWYGRMRLWRPGVSEAA